jgi:hypothetical protein
VVAEAWVAPAAAETASPHLENANGRSLFGKPLKGRSVKQNTKACAKPTGNSPASVLDADDWSTAE